MAEFVARGASTGLSFDSVFEMYLGGYETAHKVVIINDSQITDDDLKPLDNAPLTRRLILTNSQITDDGLSHLKNLKRLKNLDLTGNKNITDAGLVHLEGLNELNQVVLIGTQVTPVGVKRLQSKLPKAKILF